MLFLLPGARFAGQYLCIADLSVGYSYDKSTKQWKKSIFEGSPDKWIVAPDKMGLSKYTVKRLGEGYTSAFYEKGLNGKGHLFCALNTVTVFNMNKENGRFIIGMSMFSYIHAYPFPRKDENSDTPSLSIGKCFPI